MSVFIEGKGFRIRRSKFDYFFGRVTSENNQARSRQNLVTLSRLGIQEENDGQERLLEIFQQGLTAVEVFRLENEHGVTIRRKVLLQNENVEGDVLISYRYPDGNMESIPEVTTLIPRIYR